MSNAPSTSRFFLKKFYSSSICLIPHFKFIRNKITSKSVSQIFLRKCVHTVNTVYFYKRKVDLSNDMELLFH